MNPASIGNIIYNDVALAPCTAAASVELLKEARGDLKGMEVVMIGHSEIVGKPAASLLMAEGATVTVCHHMTRSVAMHSRRAEAILVAVGKPKLVTADMVMPGAVVIDIGINYIPDTDGNGKGRIVGDADTDEVAKVAGWITPVPGGVGPVTTAMLMRNALNAVNKQRALAGSRTNGERMMNDTTIVRAMGEKTSAYGNLYGRKTWRSMAPRYRTRSIHQPFSGSWPGTTATFANSAVPLPGITAKPWGWCIICSTATIGKSTTFATCKTFTYQRMSEDQDWAAA